MIDAIPDARIRVERTIVNTKNYDKHLVLNLEKWNSIRRHEAMKEIKKFADPYVRRRPTNVKRESLFAHGVQIVGCCRLKDSHMYKAECWRGFLS